jgi:hypothetical protein
MKKTKDDDIEIKSTAHLALVEIVVGSFGHGFKIPLTGTFLSFYQLYVCLGMLIRHKAPRISVFNVSVIVALLKTLSPFGKKITPMIAITVQGFLLWLGTSVLGHGVFGMVLGSILFVSWSLIQTALGYLILYGFDFFKMIEFVQQEIGTVSYLSVYVIVIGYWLFRIAVGLGFVFYLLSSRNSNEVWSLSEAGLARWQKKINADSEARAMPVWRKSLKDLLNPFFFISLILMSLFHFYKDTSTSQVIWFVCRTLGFGFFMFYLLRSDWVKRGLLYGFGSNTKFRKLYKKMYRVRRQIKFK